MNSKKVFNIEISEKTIRKGEKLKRRFAKKFGYTGKDEFPLISKPNPYLGTFINLHDVYSESTGTPLNPEKGMVIGTIRMGYGHYRIGMAIASAVNHAGYIPYWFDLLNFNSAGARMIKFLDYWYSLGSRISQKSKLFNNLFWDPLMGKWYKAFEKNYPAIISSEIMSDVYKNLDPQIPVLATHPFNSHAAVYAGHKNVLNLIPDNCPLGFHLSPGALQIVQGPSEYFGFRTLRGISRPGIGVGISPNEIRAVGHYVDHELLVNLEKDTEKRVLRIDKKEPRQVLISIGGAGAQQELLINLVKFLWNRIRDGAVKLFINFGDHNKALDYFKKQIPEFETHLKLHNKWEDTCNFIEKTINESPKESLHGFLHDNTYSAVYTTNLLMRVSDFMITKPSELAFYPIPKLLLQRVGGHEAWGAIRASEIGDSTPECEGLEFTLQVLNTLIEDDDLLKMYNEQIVKLKQIGTYDGAYKVVEIALERKFSQ
ncbi:MAG: hypothetical protein N3G21_13205 [Candidatus Hydrogenedentes bacterium]|nr:hypothetical protein [Candidatus Hydrogenedentota bacterium]